MNGDLGFTYRATTKGVVRIFRDGREVVVLRAGAAVDFVSKVDGRSPAAIQQLCARVTGNYKRGNESMAAAVRKSKAGSV